MTTYRWVALSVWFPTIRQPGNGLSVADGMTKYDVHCDSDKVYSAEPPGAVSSPGM